MIRKSYLSDILNSIKERGLKKAVDYAITYIKIKKGVRERKTYTGPLYATLALTYRCNFRCEMCDLPQRREEHFSGEKPLSLEELKTIIDELVELGTPAVALSGGEPFLHPYVFNVIKYAKKSGLYTQVTTNGWQSPSEAWADKIIESGLDSITFSLDGPEIIHDDIRKRIGSYKKLVEGIRLLTSRRIKKRPKIVINTVVSKKNIDYMQQHVEDMKRLPVDCFGFMLVQYHSDLGLVDSQEDKIAEDELESFVELLLREKKRGVKVDNSVKYLKDMLVYSKTGKLPHDCVAHATTLVIDEFGKFSPCFPYYEKMEFFGDTRTHSVSDFWYNHSQEMKSEAMGCRDCFWNCQVETNYLFTK